MREKGPGDGARPISPASETVAAAGVESASAIEEAEAVERVEDAAPAAGAEAVSAVAAVAGAGAADPVAAIAARLRAGEITPRQALDLIIDDVVARQVGRAVGEKSALAAELKTLLRRQSAVDPYLASKVRRLGNRS